MLYNTEWEKHLETEEWRTVLLEAANIIEREGWVQGQYVEYSDDISSRRCAIGAISKAASGISYAWDCGYSGSDKTFWFTSKAAQEAYDKMMVEINRRPVWAFWRKEWTTLDRWNDHDGRTADEVVATMRKVAAA